MSTARWRFPSNNNGDVNGINNAGIRIFDADISNSIIRESIQNSLDAAPSEESPVRVEIDRFTIDPKDFPDQATFQEALLACRRYNNGKNEDAVEFFDNALGLLDGELDVLRISDFGTTGLRGADTCEVGSDWSRLIKESGTSNKDSISGGSFGIGKFASFALSQLRCVLFSSLDDTGVPSSFGVAKLVTFEQNGNQTTGTGYLSEDDRNIAIPTQLTLPGALKREPSNPGTDIYIVAPDLEEDFVLQTVFNVLSNFMVSIWKGRLIVHVEDITISKDTLKDAVDLVSSHMEKQSAEVVEYHDLLTNGSGATIEVPFDPAVSEKAKAYADEFGYAAGECRLLIKGGDQLNRKIMRTRASGMTLFAQGNVSSSIQFTGILMIEGKSMNRDFRKMESPSHDRWDPGRTKKRKRAEKNIKRLNAWMKATVIEKLAKPVDDEVDAFGIGRFLPANTLQMASSKKRKQGSGHKTQNIQKKAILPIRDTASQQEEQIEFGTDGAVTTLGTSKSKKRKAKKRASGTGIGDRIGLKSAPFDSRLICISPTQGRYRLLFQPERDADQAAMAFTVQGEAAKSRPEVKDVHVFDENVEVERVEGNKILLRNVFGGRRTKLDFSLSTTGYCMMEVRYYEATR